MMAASGKENDNKFYDQPENIFSNYKTLKVIWGLWRILIAK